MPEESWGENWSHWRRWNIGEDHVADDAGKWSPSSSTSGLEVVEAQDQTDSQCMDSNTVYCPDCQMSLNSPKQWGAHRIGKKHRKNVQRARSGASVGDGGVGVLKAKDGSEDEKLGEGDVEDEVVVEAFFPPSTHNGVSVLNEWVQQQFGTHVAGQKLITWEFLQSKERSDPLPSDLSDE